MNYKRFGSFILAVGAITFGVLTGNLPAIGVGMLAVIVTFYRLSESTPLPKMASHYPLVIGAVLLAGILSVLTYHVDASEL
jgi:hypothetical protein